MNRQNWKWTLSAVVSGLLFAGGLRGLPPVAEQVENVLFENERVRVQKVILEPGVEYPEHTHQLPHVGVIIKGGTLQFHEGKNVEEVTFQDGDAGWREAGVTHRITNRSSHAVHVVEVELK